MDSIILFFAGVVVALAGAFWWLKRGKGESVEIEHFTMIERFHTLGELTVFRAATKEIITASDHYFGNFGQKYFRWLISNQKMAIIFQFDIDYKYDLQSKEFKIEESQNSINITMPPCIYATNIKDIKFYDEQGAKLMPWLLPSLISDVFSEGFDENTKNKLIEEAKKQVGNLADEIARTMKSTVQTSAKQTLLAIAQNMSKKDVVFTFTNEMAHSSSVGYDVANDSKVAS